MTLRDLIDSPRFIASGPRKTFDATGKQSGASHPELTLDSERGVTRGIVSFKNGTVWCARHHAMNSMGGGVWRCLALGCRAAAYKEPSDA